jgi:NADH-quinone oxidoreductase subunit E
MNSSKSLANGRAAAPPLDVLIIDDDESHLESCCQILEDGGYRVAAARNGQRGLQIAGSDHPGIVLIAIGISGMTALEALDRLAKTEPSAAPIVITSDAAGNSAVEAAKLGAIDFVAKPCNQEKLLDSVRRGLVLSGLRRQAKSSGTVQTPRLAKHDLLLQGLNLLGEAYSAGIEKRQLLEELGSLENEAKQHAENKKKERAIQEARNEFLEADAIMGKYNFQKNALIQMLLDIQEKFRWLPRHILSWMSGRLDIPLREIYIIANFYEAFSLEPRGRHAFQVCTGTACHVRGASELLTRVSASLGIQAGQTDSNRNYSLETVHCLGCCALAPVVQIDDEYHRDPSRSNLDKIIKTMKTEETQA